VSARQAKLARQAERVLEFRPKDIRRMGRFLNGQVALAAWESPQFLVVLYAERSGRRLSINRARLKPDGSGRWDDGITWDTLQEIKSKIGLGDCWGVEVFPPDDELVDVANIRHIWLLPEPPAFAWRASTGGAYQCGMEAVKNHG
jgi:hypothetical protein